ncbi:MAG: glutathione S-transferase family protein [Proteobacteria bacterium]|nr:glutathione S-transferase family protein [Pseudomonadota bacterium]
MKLYQIAVSPFPPRVRLSLYMKGIDFEVVEPPGFDEAGPKGAFLALNPMGRVPVLILDDQRALPESEVICEYLDDAFPKPSLRPSDPWQRAQVRLLSRISDIYLVMAMVPLFDLVVQPSARRDAAAVGSAHDRVGEALDFLDHYIGTSGYAVGDAVTTADGTLAPMLVLVDEWMPACFGQRSTLPPRSNLSRYWQRVQSDPLVGRIADEMRVALAERRRRREMAAG